MYFPACFMTTCKSAIILLSLEENEKKNILIQYLTNLYHNNNKLKIRKYFLTEKLWSLIKKCLCLRFFRPIDNKNNYTNF